MSMSLLNIKNKPRRGGDEGKDVMGLKNNSNQDAKTK